MNAAPGRPVLLVLASTYPRYAEDTEPAFVHQLSRRLCDRFDVVAVVPSAPGARAAEQMDGVEIQRFRYAPRRWETLVNDGGIGANLKRHPVKWALVPLFMLGMLLAALRTARRRKVAVIHAHWLIPQGVIAVIVGWLLSIPVVVTSHGADVFSFKGRALAGLKRWVARRAVRLTAVSSAMRNEMVRLGMPADRITVRPMGVDLRLSYRPAAGTARSTDEILFVGRLVEKKGLRYLIQALPQILAAHPKAQLTVAGFGPEHASLQALARTLEVSERVCFCGAVEQARMPALYQRAAVLVAPFIRARSGDEEGMPLVLMEAIGCGCPLVVGRVSAVADIFEDGEQDLVVEATDVSALAQAVLRQMAQPQAAVERTQAIRQRLSERLDWSAVASGYAAELEAALRRAPSRRR